MKQFLFLFIMLSVQEKCPEEKGLNFLYATSQNWSGGAAGTHGTYYKVYFLLKDRSLYQFDSLWVAGKRIPMEAKQSAVPSDTIMLLANDYKGIRGMPDGNQLANGVEAKPPIETQAEGLVGYMMNGERKYFPVPAFTVLKPIAYQ